MLEQIREFRVPCRCKTAWSSIICPYLLPLPVGCPLGLTLAIKVEGTLVVRLLLSAASTCRFYASFIRTSLLLGPAEKFASVNNLPFLHHHPLSLFFLFFTLSPLHSLPFTINSFLDHKLDTSTLVHYLIVCSLELTLSSTILI
ncbi:hypothetical protein BKA60DRAFT_243027 [Fusarium oxysporum]|nr:hypothetical protein BKA60DRAFT_243027 [Fusarium oxysporum]